VIRRLDRFGADALAHRIHSLGVAGVEDEKRLGMR
jgi:hypothetical protein